MSASHIEAQLILYQPSSSHISSPHSTFNNPAHSIPMQLILWAQLILYQPSSSCSAEIMLYNHSSFYKSPAHSIAARLWNDYIPSQILLYYPSISYTIPAHTVPAQRIQVSYTSSTYPLPVQFILTSFSHPKQFEIIKSGKLPLNNYENSMSVVTFWYPKIYFSVFPRRT
jgi:hypothetical protein